MFCKAPICFHQSHNIHYTIHFIASGQIFNLFAVVAAPQHMMDVLCIIRQCCASVIYSFTCSYSLCHREWQPWQGEGLHWELLCYITKCKCVLYYRKGEDYLLFQRKLLFVLLQAKDRMKLVKLLVFVMNNHYYWKYVRESMQQPQKANRRSYSLHAAHVAPICIIKFLCLSSCGTLYMCLQHSDVPTQLWSMWSKSPLWHISHQFSEV